MSQGLQSLIRPGFGAENLSTQRHAVNVLFSEAEYVKLVRLAAEPTVQEGRRVSLAELVRRLTFSNESKLDEETMNA